MDKVTPDISDEDVKEAILSLGKEMTKICIKLIEIGKEKEATVEAYQSYLEEWVKRGYSASDL